jgi:nitrite reductase/ring-hydroxylating ferredoxin subunit
MVISIPVADVPPDKIVAVPVNDQLTLAVCQFEGAYYAANNRCPHRGAPLSDGTLVGELMVCPLHHFKFSVKTGRCVMPKHLKLASIRVEQQGDQLVIEVEPPPAAGEASGTA